MNGIEKPPQGVHPDLCRLAEQTAAWLQKRGRLASDVVVLVPYAQLMSQARQAWLQTQGRSGSCLLPRFLSTQQWASDMQALFPQPASPLGWSAQASISHANARRMLAQSGLDQAFSGQATAVLAETMMQAAQALVVRMQAMQPARREEWLQSMREQRVWGFVARDYSADALERSQMDAVEPALLRIALEWVGMTHFDTDVLWQSEVRQSTPALVVWQGLQTEGLAQSLAEHWGQDSAVLSWPEPVPMLEEKARTASLQCLVASDAEQEARWTAACVIRHLQAGARQVGVVALDRALVRRVRAMLAARGLGVYDETGWKLSTTHAATQLMSWLTASRHQASTHEVLDAAKCASTLNVGTLSALERWLTRTRHFQWPGIAVWEQGKGDAQRAHAAEAALQIEQWRLQLQKRQSLAAWLMAFHEVAQQTGLLAQMERDEAGQAVLAALHLDLPARLAQTHPELARERWTLGEFSAWAKAALEAASFVPVRQAVLPGEPEVSVIPLSQVLGRRLDALVVAGCDELHLPWCPPDLHPWTRVQRERLGLGNDELRSEMQCKAWQYALGVAKVTLLRRQQEQADEIAASPLLRQTLQELRLRQLDGLVQADAPMELVQLQAPTIEQPMPSWDEDQLRRGRLLTQLTPSAYEDLRRCPYRFHAKRLLGLRQEDELAEETDKRDWGNWVHQVLFRFHTERNDRQALREQLDQAAMTVEAQMRLDGAGFLPFRMAWPDLRDAYLNWLQTWEAQGGRFVQGELDARSTLEEAGLTLLGRIDRIDSIDHAGGGQRMIFDYKTESQSKSKKRVTEPLEDAQLAFYALLLQDRHAATDLSAAYLSLPDSGESKQGQRELPQVRAFALEDLQQNAEALREGIASDVKRIRQSQALLALGDGPVCEHCEVRGLCRRDFWRGA